MKRIIIRITGVENFFRRYVEVFQGILHLRGREAEIFMWLLYHNNSKRGCFISHEIRRDISTRCNMSISSLNNCICSLRYRGIVVGDGQSSMLNQKHSVSYKVPFTINFEIYEGDDRSQKV